MTYEETAKALRLCGSDDESACQKCPRQAKCSEDKNMGGLLIDAADAIEELSKPRWIPVTERLPEPYVDVIATDGEENVGVASYQEKGNYWLEDGLFDDTHVEVTHWMPLPEPPKEET